MSGTSVVKGSLVSCWFLRGPKGPRQSLAHGNIEDAGGIPESSGFPFNTEVGGIHTASAFLVAGASRRSSAVQGTHTRRATLEGRRRPWVGPGKADGAALVQKSLVLSGAASSPGSSERRSSWAASTVEATPLAGEAGSKAAGVVGSFHQGDLGLTASAEGLHGGAQTRSPPSQTRSRWKVILIYGSGATAGAAIGHGLGVSFGDPSLQSLACSPREVQERLRTEACSPPCDLPS